MRRLLVARLVQGLAVVAIVTTIAFVLIRLAPGEPFAFDETLSADLQARLRAQYGYDEPVAVQYLNYVGRVAKGDLGYSTMHHRPAMDVIATYLPRTLLLSGVSLVLSIVLGMAIGTWQASRYRTRAARVSAATMVGIYSIPDFFLGMLLILVFSRWLHLLPAAGMTDPVLYEYFSLPRRIADRATHLVLPALTLTLLTTTIIARQQRGALLDVLPHDFVRVARAKGVAERDVVRRHALRNALSPVVAISGVLLPALLGGTFFIEQVFAWPGMGTMTIAAIVQKDYDLVTASVVVGAVLVTLGNLAADLIHAVVDPRLRTV